MAPFYFPEFRLAFYMKIFTEIFRTMDVISQQKMKSRKGTMEQLRLLDCDQR
jgi:hypothetical protein